MVAESAVIVHADAEIQVLVLPVQFAVRAETSVLPPV